jgi:(R)-2-hydroxyglutarate dehydrogenase
MAGLYGHEKANRARSEAIYRISWSGCVADSRYTDRLVATGYSCRSQAAIVDGVHLLHPVQLLLTRLKGNPERAAAHARATYSARSEHHEEY